MPNRKDCNQSGCNVTKTYPKNRLRGSRKRLWHPPKVTLKMKSVSACQNGLRTPNSLEVDLSALTWVYIRLPHEMGLERRVTLLLPPLVPSYPPPLKCHFRVDHFGSGSTKSVQKWFQKQVRFQTRLWIDLDPDWGQIVVPKSLQNRSQIHTESIPNLTKIVSEALRSDKWSPEALKVVSPNVGQPFFIDFDQFCGTLLGAKSH